MLQDMVNKVKQYFKVQELVCPHCYKKFGEDSWKFLSKELLSILYTLRVDIIKKPMIINTWFNSGQFSQRGLRCNMCQLVKSKNSVYLSAHCLGRAVDFNVPNMTIPELHKLIESNKDKFEYPVRVEDISTAPTWLHIDVLPVLGSNNKLTTFKG